MKRYHRIVFLSIVLLYALDTLGQYRGNDFEEGNYSYRILSPNSVTLVKAKNQTGHVTVPEDAHYKSYHFKVISISYSCYEGSEIESITIPDYISYIGGAAFRNCKKLKKVIMPTSIKVIEDFTFDGCGALSDIELPTTVHKIGASAFNECTSLRYLTFHEGIDSIGRSAFYNSGLKYIYLPKSMRFIEHEAFYGCNAEKLIMDGEIESVGDLAFSQCTNLKSVVIQGGNIKSLGTALFGGCSSLTDVKLEEGITSSEGFAFSSCTALKAVTLPESMTDLGMGDFQNCKSLQEVNIPQSVCTIPYSMFKGCLSLKKIKFPASVYQINGHAFEHCAQMESITFQGEIITINEEAFQDCVSLSVIECMMDTVTTPYYENCFDDITFKRAKVVVRNNLLDQYKADRVWGKFNNIEGQDYLTPIRCIKIETTGNGAVVYKDKSYRNQTEIIQFKIDEDAKVYMLPDDNYKCIGIQRIDGVADVLLMVYGEGELSIKDIPANAKLIANFRNDHSVITIKQVDEGCVKLLAERNRKFQCGIKPSEGWRMHSVSLNGVDVTDEFRDSYTLPPLTHDITFVIAFEKENPNGIFEMGLHRNDVIQASCRASRRSSK